MNTKTNQFELLRLRRDKDSPNSLSTAINVMNAIKNPVDLEIIKEDINHHSHSCLKSSRE